MGVGGRCHATAALHPVRPGTTVYEARWATQSVWTGVENLVPVQGFDPQTVQPVASRYTYCAIPAHCIYFSTGIYNKIAFS